MQGVKDAASLARRFSAFTTAADQSNCRRLSTIQSHLVVCGRDFYTHGGTMTQRPDNSGCPSIKELFDREGSDKGKWYGGLYDVLLQPQRQTIRCVVEIGIGTLLQDAVSSMVGYAADHYRPGGSLRAWRNFLPQAEVYGLDIAPDTQFSDEPRIHTYLCDSTDSQRTSEILSQITHRPDLIIDDGWHDLSAQIKTLKNFLPALQECGLYVVEDVWPDHVLTLINELNSIHPGCHSFVDRSWGTCVAIVIRKPPKARE
jgi:hypothetical protein